MGLWSGFRTSGGQTELNQDLMFYCDTHLYLFYLKEIDFSSSGYCVKLLCATNSEHDHLINKRAYLLTWHNQYTNRFVKSPEHRRFKKYKIYIYVSCEQLHHSPSPPHPHPINQLAEVSAPSMCVIDNVIDSAGCVTHGMNPCSMESVCVVN